MTEKQYNEFSALIESRGYKKRNYANTILNEHYYYYKHFNDIAHEYTIHFLVYDYKYRDDVEDEHKYNVTPLLITMYDDKRIDLQITASVPDLEKVENFFGGFVNTFLRNHSV